MTRIEALRKIDPDMRREAVRIGLLTITTERDMAIVERFEVLRECDLTKSECYQRLGKCFKLHSNHIRKIVDTYTRKI